MTLGDLLNNLATKIGVQNDPSFVDLLSRTELSNVEVDDEFGQRFDTGLMSLEGAKNNREVLNHFKPIVLTAIDDKLAVLAEKYGIAAEIAAEKSSYKKFEILENRIAEKIAEAEAKAGTGTKSEEVQRLTKQLADLQTQLQKVTEAKDAELKATRDANAKQQLDMLINFELNGKRYANSELGETNVTIARTLIDKALNEQKAIIVNDNGQIKIKQAENPQLDYLDASFKPVSFSDFSSRILAEKHLLEVSDGADAQQHQQRIDVRPGGGDSKVVSSKFDAAAAGALADLES